MATGLNLLLLVYSSAFLLTAVHVEAITSRCSACRAITTELQARLDKEKPRNHIDLRHRLDSQGKRYGKSIDYKVSELRAMELLDELCDQLGSYSLYPVDCFASTGMCKPATAKPPPPPPPPSPPPPTADDSDNVSTSDAADADVPPAAADTPSVETPAEPQAGADAQDDAAEPAAASAEPEEKPRRRRQWVKTKGLEHLVEKLKLPRDEDTARTKELKNHCGRVMEDHEDAMTAAIMRGAFEEPGAAEAYLCYELTKACPSDKLEAGERVSGEAAAAEQPHPEL